MHVKKGDNVIVLTGKDKGKTGKIIKALPREMKIIVEGVNIKKLHKRATRSGQKGQIISQAAPFHVSNVRLEEVKETKTSKKVEKKSK